mmetsp:Transcript_82013/g.232284  ORF Transcript_82013/g.232284 Transcript_82013/m.232284 type:complete len:270 (-) Transcript_82013:145-954(-)
MGAGQGTELGANTVTPIPAEAGCLAIATSFVIIAMSFLIQRPRGASAAEQGEIAMDTEVVEGDSTPPPVNDVPERPSAPSPKEGNFNSRTETVVDDQGNIFTRTVSSASNGAAASDDNADRRAAPAPGGMAHNPQPSGDLRKSQSMLAFATTADEDDHGLTGMSRNMSASNLKHVSSFCANGRRASETSAKRPRRNISFGSKEMFAIPTRNSFSDFDKQNMWYDHLDVNSFIGNELQRRRVVGITSTNALCAEPTEGIPEEDDAGMVTF